MKHCNWTMLLNVEFDHMNVNNILCVKVEVLLWNKVSVEDVVNAMKELEPLKKIMINVVELLYGFNYNLSSSEYVNMYSCQDKQ